MSTPSGIFTPEVFIGMDVASVNSAVATSAGVARPVQIRPADKKANTRWWLTATMAYRLLADGGEIADGFMDAAVAIEDVRFGGGGSYDNTGELKGALKWALAGSGAPRALLAFQPQSWRSVMNVASGLPEKVRYEVYCDRARALGFESAASNAKGREDETAAFLLAVTCEWVWRLRFLEQEPTVPEFFPLNLDAVEKLARDPEVWLHGL